MAEPLARRLGAVARRYLPPDALREFAHALAREVADAAVDALLEEKPPRRTGQRPPASNAANLETLDDATRERALTEARRHGLIK